MSEPRQAESVSGSDTRAAPVPDSTENPTRLTACGPTPVLPGTPAARADRAVGEEAPARFGNYRILRELGRGGMGVVYLAFDEKLRRDVALKVMLASVAANPESKERFLREARAAARITSDHVVTIHEADEVDGTPYIALQYLKGIPLDGYLKKKGPLSIPKILKVGRETALGLAAAHRIGVVHRDIKPGNIWLEAPNGRVRILDFGLAKPVGPGDDPELTVSGAILGTPAYMSPEQTFGPDVDVRSDLFSLGSMLYRLLAGRLPFERPSPMATMRAIVDDQPTPLRSIDPNIPEPLADFVRRLMAKNPDDRPASAKAVAEELVALGHICRSGAADLEPVPEDAPVTVLAPPSSRRGDRSLDRTESDGDFFLISSVPKVEGTVPRSRFAVIAAGALVLAALLVVGIVVARFGGATPTATSDGAPTPTVPAGTRTPYVAVQVGDSPFDELDANAIPREERFDWQPKELVGVIGTHARRHWLPVAAVAMSEDGTKAATASGDRSYPAATVEVVVWDVRTQKPHRRMTLPKGQTVDGLQFGDGDSRLYLFGQPTMQVWDITAEPPVRLPMPAVPDFEVRHGGWLLEGGKTACLHNRGKNSEVAVFSLDASGPAARPAVGDRRKLGDRFGPANWPVCVVAPGADTVVYPDPQGKLRRARVRDGKFVDEEELPIPLLSDDYPRGLSPDGKRLAVVAAKEIVLWDLSAVPPKRAGRLDRGDVWRVEFSPCGRWLATCSDTGVGVRLFRTDGPETLFVATLDEQGLWSGGVRFSGDGNRAVVGDDQGSIRFWDLSNAQPKELSPCDADAAFHLITWSPDTRLSVSGELMLRSRYGRDTIGFGRERTWRFDSPAPRRSNPPDTFIPVAAEAPTLSVAGGRWLGSNPIEAVPRRSRLWSFGGGRWDASATPFGGPTETGVVSGDGGLYISMTGGGKVDLEGWDVSSFPVRRWSVPYPANYPIQPTRWRTRAIAASRDGSRFAAVTSPADSDTVTDLTVWRNAGTKPELQSSVSLTSSVVMFRAAISPDGSRLVHNGSELALLDVAGNDPRLLGTLRAGIDSVFWIAYSPDGGRIAVAGFRGITVFDADSMLAVWKWDASPGAVWWLDWAADGRHIVSHNANKTLYVLRVPETAVRK